MANVHVITAEIQHLLRDATFELYNKRPLATSDVDTFLFNPVQFADVVLRYQWVTYNKKASKGTFSYTIGVLMDKDLKFIRNLVSVLGFYNLNSTIDVYHNLLWYFNMAEEPNAIGLADYQKRYISGLGVPELLNILGPRYAGPQDKASLLFAITSGRSAHLPCIANIPRYPQVAAYGPKIVWMLAYNLYNIMDEQGPKGHHPPYIYVSLQNPSIVEPIIAIVNVNNVFTLMKQYGIIYSGLYALSVDEALRYFISEISNYEPVLTRPQTPPLPPDLINKTPEEITALLKIYATKELYDAYDPGENWSDRESLIKAIIFDMEPTPHWALRKNCGININIGDIYLSYGLHKNYQCYTSNELVNSFDVFKFGVPNTEEEFPLSSIDQLLQLLQNMPLSLRSRTALIDKIKNVLYIRGNHELIRNNTTVPIINGLSPNQVNEIKDRVQNNTFEVYSVKTENRQNYSETMDYTPEQFADMLHRYITINYDNKVVNLMKVLMTQKDASFIVGIMNALGFINLVTTIDVCYNLLWYLNVAQNPFANGLNLSERGYISGLESSELIEFLGPRYNGPQDKASLLFAIVSGRSMIQYNLIRDLSVYSPKIIWNMAELGYIRAIVSFDDNDRIRLSPYPPYMFVARSKRSAVETIFLTANETNVDELMNRYEILLPTWNPPTNQEQKVIYFLTHIRYYMPVLARDRNILPPPVLPNNTTFDQAWNILSPYTIKELVEAYEPVSTWYRRERLVSVISQESRGGSNWSWRHRYCNNDDTMNVIEAEPHGQINKDDPNDPTISYGVQRNYRCYQASELEQSFRDYDGTFLFRVPDHTNPPQIDPTTGNPLMREFPLESIQELKDLIWEPPAGYNVRDLVAKVVEGLILTDITATRIQGFKDRYNQFNEEQKSIIKLYLAWLFMYGMWMRFWKGPGHEWPTVRINVIDPQQRGERCGPEERDEHIFIQQDIRTVLIERYERDADLRQWIEELPRIMYNFQTGEANIGELTIKSTLDGIQTGIQCMGAGSDFIIETSYYLITRIVDINTPEAFDQFINLFIPPILDIERQVVARQLLAIRNPEINDQVRNRVRILNERRQALDQPTPQQETFRPTLVAPNVHID